MKLPDGIKCVIRASDVSSFLFCEHQLGKERIRTAEMSKGSELHQEYEEESDSMAGEAISPEEAKDLKKNIMIAEELVTSIYGDILLIGKPDRAVRENGVWVVEDKKSTNSRKEKVFENQKMQTYFYCELIRRWLNDRAKYNWKVHLQDQKTKEIYHSEGGEYGENERQRLLWLLERIRNIMLGEDRAMHHGNPKKCEFCSVKDCGQKLM
jgi:CRISPR/Cas system-associated exonuclease Cas4 (RecB family)